MLVFISHYFYRLEVNYLPNSSCYAKCAVFNVRIMEEMENGTKQILSIKKELLAQIHRALCTGGSVRKQKRIAVSLYNFFPLPV